MTTGGGTFGLPVFHTLACTFDLEGSVQDDVFTGYLTTLWTGGSGFDSADDPTTTAIIAYVKPGSAGPITDPVSGGAVLTADDGILVGTDMVELTCLLP